MLLFEYTVNEGTSRYLHICDTPGYDWLHCSPFLLRWTIFPYTLLAFTTLKRIGYWNIMYLKYIAYVFYGVAYLLSGFADTIHQVHCPFIHVWCAVILCYTFILDSSNDLLICSFIVCWTSAAPNGILLCYREIYYLFACPVMMTLGLCVPVMWEKLPVCMTCHDDMRTGTSEGREITCLHTLS